MIAALAVGVLAALPAPAGAVLSGTNGRIAFIEGPAFGNTQLLLRTVTGSTGGGSKSPPLAADLTQQFRHPSWAPDRTKIAFAKGPSAGPYTIYTLDLTTPGATPQPIAAGDRPAWSPDGTRIAYENGNDIFVHPLNGGGDLNLTTTLTPRAWKAAWSPDSQTLYYGLGDIAVAPNGTTNDVTLRQQPANNSNAGSELLHVSGAHVFQPSISPDGTKMCFTHSTQGDALPTSASVLVVPVSAPGSPPTVITSSGVGDDNCTWSPDGTKIAYTEDYAGNGEVFMEESDGTSAFPINLTDNTGTFDGNPDWAPDARPECPDSTVSTAANTPITFQVTCNDTGPAYEQSEVREFAKSQPSNGTLTQEFAGDPLTYTPNPGFVGTDSFVVQSFDEFGFGADTGTVTITVRAPQNPPPPPTVKCAGRTATIVGTSGADVIAGTSGRDIIAGLAGNDAIRAGGGNDLICAGSGRDRVAGGRGNDREFGGTGPDRLLGNGGNDVLNGGGGRDTLIGGRGRDRLNGAAARDVCRGSVGKDRASRCERRSSIP